MGQILGIDFGTTNSAMAIIENGKPVIIPNSEGNRLTPSIVSFISEDEFVVGDLAKKQALLNPQNTVISVKKILGRKFAEVKQFVKNVPYEVIALKNDTIKIKIHQKLYSPQEITALILQKLKHDAQTSLNAEIEEAVITVPSKFGFGQIKALREAGELAGLNIRRIISEPTAACLAHGFNRTGKDIKISVFDLGGGSLDVSILELGDGIFEVLATYGDTDLGGDDFDFAIAQWLLKEFENKENVDLSNDSRVIYRLKEAAEKAKIELSESTVANIYIPYISIGSTIKNLEATITRETFKSLSASLIERSQFVCEKAMSIYRRDRINEEKLDELVFVGGSTRIPFIKEAISQLYNLKLNSKSNPDEVVALGAAVQGGALTGEVKDVLLLDVTSNDLGVRAFNGKTEVFIPIIRECTTIPTKSSTIFLDWYHPTFVDQYNKQKNEKDGTTSFKKYIQNEFIKPITVSSTLKGFEILIIESSGTTEKVVGKLFLGDVPVNSGYSEIEVSFDINANGILHVQASEKNSKRSSKIRIETATNFTENELFDIKQKFQNLEENKKKSLDENAIVKSAEVTVRKSELQLLSFHKSISLESKERTITILDMLKAYIKVRDIDRIKDTLVKLDKEWQYISQEIYLNDKEMKSKSIRIFISYAHDDNVKGLVDLFCDELRKQLKVLEQDYNFEIFKDDKILMGEDWHQRLQTEVRNADVAVLLLSSSFLTSDYISKNELEKFLEKNTTENSQILCPIYFDPFDFSRYDILKRYQFFKPNGSEYGPTYAYLKDDLCYGDLVTFDPQTGLPQPNRNRSRYMVSFVKELEKVLRLRL